jgi:hypothetical protein
VSIPDKRKESHNQLRATPPDRTISVIRLGVAMEKVVATIEIPNSHQGMFRPERKKLAESFPPLFALIRPIIVRTIRNRTIMIQSMLSNAIQRFFILDTYRLPALRFS